MPRLALAVLLAALLLAGCGGRPGDTRSVQDGPADAPSDVAAAVPTVANASAPVMRPPWPELAAATIRPGVVITTTAGACTTNFVFVNATSVHVGFAAHCLVLGESDEPCRFPALQELGTQVTVDGARAPATVSYSSFSAMRDAGETDANACGSNDFALAALDPSDWGVTHPAMLHFGGPTRVADRTTVAIGDKAMGYGRTPLLPDEQALRAHEGYVATDAEMVAGGWIRWVYFVPAGIPGDSGSGAILADGAALGPLVHTASTGANGIVHLDRALEYLRAHGGPDVELATWELLESGVLPSPPS